MATGLIALLDDVAAIAKMAAASLDDVAAQTVKAGAKAAGVVIDDAAVTPRYVVGLKPERELPIIGRIALGSLKNKLVFLLPGALLLGFFAPWAITPLLMLGGIFLCYEGAEKLYAALFPHAAHQHETAVLGEKTDPVALENEKVAGAVRTDFILSAEIMALTLSTVSDLGFYNQAAVLAAVGIAITLVVYGTVAIIVKVDDVGLAMARTSSSALRAIGRGLVVGMPVFLAGLAFVGTAAMLWVGGSILIHGLAQLGTAGPEHLIHDLSQSVVDAVTVAPAVVGWFATSALQAVLAIVVGAVVIVLMQIAVAPIMRRLRSGPSA